MPRNTVRQVNPDAKSRKKVTEKSASAAPKKRGRPSSFSQEMAAQICGRIAAGESLNRISKTEGFPDQVTVYRWLASNESFRQMYTQAREEQAETLADEIVDIADADPEIEQVRDKDGEIVEMRVHAAYVAYQKNRIEARKWVAAKLKPRKYGEKVDVNHGVQPENPLAKLLEQVQGTPLRPGAESDDPT